MPYTTNTFWALNTPALNGTEVLVTCTGFQMGVDCCPAHTLTGCNVTTALVAGAAIESGALTNANAGTIGGFIKVERQDAAKVWHDVTMEFLNYGISGPNLAGTNLRSVAERDHPAAASARQRGDRRGHVQLSGDVDGVGLRPERALRHSRGALSVTPGPGDNRLLPRRRDALRVDQRRQPVRLVRGDRRLRRRNRCAVAASDNGGFSVYFSDRRNNRNASNQETGEYGFEDIINPLSATGTPNAVLDTGEDVNGSGMLDTYGNIPELQRRLQHGAPGAVRAADQRGEAERRWCRAPYALHNRALFFRRALKLTNGGLGNIVMPRV